ncbi:MAG: hypothetical protein OEX13_11640, partial [Gammaproteobacteria bacterium]|nr:hypothetical protein [Gammaproteobacteria bacterium]
MGGHSILYLGRSDFAADYIEALKASKACSRFSRSETLRVPAHDAANIELVLFEAGPGITQSGHTLKTFIQSLQHYPLIALTRHDQEHRGIAAVRAGAQHYLCV